VRDRHTTRLVCLCGVLCSIGHPRIFQLADVSFVVNKTTPWGTRDGVRSFLFARKFATNNAVDRALVQRRDRPPQKSTNARRVVTCGIGPHDPRIPHTVGSVAGTAPLRRHG
jgi:hypothetical protein